MQTTGRKGRTQIKTQLKTLFAVNLKQLTRMSRNANNAMVLFVRLCARFSE